MRSRLFGVAVATLLGAGFAVAQQPVPVPLPPMPAPAALAQPPVGMMPVPVAAPAPVYAPAPIVVQGQPGCAAPSAPCAPAAAAPCPPAAADCGPKAKSSLFDRLFTGTVNPVGCGCLASERNFLFGSCRNFYTPGRTCNGTPVAYGCGSGECGHGPKDPCKHINSFHNR